MSGDLAARIEARLDELKLTPRKASMKAGQHPDAIRNILRGRSKSPRTDTLSAIAKVLGWDLGMLAGTEDLDAEATSDQALASTPTFKVKELDVRAGAGNGMGVEHIEHSMRSTERIVSVWQVPADLFRGQTTAQPDAMRVITVYGDSMEPELPPGARVVVDTSDRMPTPPGIFVVFDGLGLVIKRVEHVPHSDPPKVRISSDNPRYSPYERTIEEAHIQGRVIGHWKWK